MGSYIGHIVSAFKLRYIEAPASGAVLSATEAVCDPLAAARFSARVYEAEDCDQRVKEYSFAILLNRRNFPMGYVKVSEGGITQTVLDVRLVVKAALDLNATGVVFCHNHPSGSTNPGASDMRETESLRKALNLMDISLIDHIILAGDKFFTFSDGRSMEMPKE